jgi:transposase, IS6 family
MVFCAGSQVTQSHSHVPVRQYLRHKLSLRNVVEIVAERGLSFSLTAIMRWVKRFTPEFVKRWDRFAR